jgi:splicing factor 3B subunit 2
MEGAMVVDKPLDHELDGVNGSSTTTTTNVKNAVNNASNNSVNESTNNKKKNKNKKKKKKKKSRKDSNSANNQNQKVPEEKVEIEYIRDEIDLQSDPSYEEFAKIMDFFARPEELCAPQVKESAMQDEGGNAEGEAEQKPERSAEASTENGVVPEKKSISKKEKKRQKRLSIPILKQLVKRSDVVEIHDVNSSDPYFLVYLKAYRNTVAVPRHWSQKRKFLQGKRGIEKPPFQLPEFIAATGIAKIREAYQQKEDQKRLKQKQREKMQPKMGRIDIDYQVLHDAFFKFQTKPKLTIQGDLYYEMKEFELQMKEKKPGQLSDELKRALGMPDGAPPPWLINMQRYGPPPSYPALKVPGLNAPIPPGASWGYHPGGWGKPPVDEFGRPLYGDVFGTAAPAPPPEITAPIERKHWGELEEEEVEEEEEEEEEAVENTEELDMEAENPEIADGISSVPSGLETPDTIDLRKVSKKEEADEGSKQLFTVLEQAEARVGGALYGSSHKYVIPGEKKESKGKDKVDLIKSQKTEKVSITLNPSEVEDMDTLTDDLLKKKYEQYLAEKAEQEKGEDFSDMIAEQSKKRKKSQKEGDKKSKKYKDFKF